MYVIPSCVPKGKVFGAALLASLNAVMRTFFVEMTSTNRANKETVKRNQILYSENLSSLEGSQQHPKCARFFEKRLELFLTVSSY